MKNSNLSLTKHKPSTGKIPSALPHLVTVRFEFSHPTATKVSVAGSFNDWQPEAKSLRSTGTGRWWKDTSIAPGNYEYCLVVDGKWIADPLAPESVPNPFGGRNSVLHVAASPEAKHLADAENLPLKNAVANQEQKKMNIRPFATR